MSAHLTEEEQIEALKRWWQSNGKIVVAVILAGIIGWFGWNLWQDRQQTLAESASSKYSELMATINTAPGTSLTDEQTATARQRAGEIIAAQPDSLYGNLAALILAQLAVDSGDLAQAETQLKAVIGHAANAGMAKLAKLRLARVLSAQGDYEAALALVSGSIDAAFEAAYAETRGDIYMAQDQLALAQTAYQQALAALPPQQASRRSLLQLKLDNTRVAGNATAEEPMSATEGDV